MTPFDIPELAYRRTIGSEELRRLMGREKGACTWCGEPVPRGRRSWCSQACIDLFRERWWPGHIRRLAFKRDKGVCQQCGHDTQYWRRWRDKLKRGYAYVLPDSCCERQLRWGEARKINRRGRKNRRRFERYRAAWHKSLSRLMHWDADHTLPVIRGGALLGMVNIRTLCRRCHVVETAALAAERAVERRPPEPATPMADTRQLSFL